MPCKLIHVLAYKTAAVVHKPVDLFIGMVMRGDVVGDAFKLPPEREHEAMAFFLKYFFIFFPVNGYNICTEVPESSKKSCIGPFMKFNIQMFRIFFHGKIDGSTI